MKLREWERYWERSAPDEFMLNELQLKHPIRKVMAEEAKIGKNVLDVGCGRGLSYPSFKEAGIKYVGVDLTKKFLDFARKTFPTIEVYEANALDLPFTDRSFDTVCCKDLIEHIHPQDVPQVIREMWRVTKLKMLIAFFLPPSEVGSHVHLHRDKYWNNMYNVHDLERLFKKLKLGEGEIRIIPNYAAIKLRPPPGRGPITHAPLYIFTKDAS